MVIDHAVTKMISKLVWRQHLITHAVQIKTQTIQTNIFFYEFKAVLAALNVEHGAAGEGLTEGEKKASLEVGAFFPFFLEIVSTWR